jgi:hypothetical protein
MDAMAQNSLSVQATLTTYKVIHPFTHPPMEAMHVDAR